MGRSPVVVRAPSPWKFRIPPAIPGGNLLNPTTPEEQDLAALREGDKPPSRTNGKRPIRTSTLSKHEKSTIVIMEIFRLPTLLNLGERSLILSHLRRRVI